MKIKPKKAISIKRSIFYLLMTIIAVSLILNSLVWFITENNDLNRTIDNLKQREVDAEKQLLKDEVNKTISDIYFQVNYRKGAPLESLKNEVLKWISGKRLVYGGYLFVNSIDGQALVYDGKMMEEYKNVKEMADPNGLRLFDIEMEAYASSDGKFMEYLFKPMDSDIPEEKISFIKGFHEWKWIIGAGIYKKMPNQEIEQEKAKYYQSFYDKIFLIFINAFILTTIGYLVVRYTGNRLSSQVNFLRDSLRKVPFMDGPINLDSIKFDEFKSIGTSINQMISEKKELEKTVEEKDESLKLVFKAAENVAFILTDLGGKYALIKEFSQGAESIFGYKKDEIIDKELSMLFQSDAFGKFDKIQGLLSKGLKGFSGEATLISKNNQPFAGFFTIHPLFKDKKVAGSILVIINISNSKKTEEELKKLKINLEQKVEERTGEILRKNKELEEKNAELENYNNLFIGREFRINELKQKIKELESKLNDQTNHDA
jgi:PAS domain S-box-containing protein